MVPRRRRAAAANASAPADAVTRLRLWAVNRFRILTIRVTTSAPPHSASTMPRLNHRNRNAMASRLLAGWARRTIGGGSLVTTVERLVEACTHELIRQVLLVDNATWVVMGVEVRALSGT